MDSDPDVPGHGSGAKRIRLDTGASAVAAAPAGAAFASYTASLGGPEGTSADCDSADSGYEASMLESIPASSIQTSPHTDVGDLQESLSSLSETYLQTPTHVPDQLETSQDSLEVDDDNASTVSHLSELSGLSDFSGQDWKPMAGSMIWIQQQMQKGVNPRTLLTELGVDLDQIPEYVGDVTLWKIIINMLAEPPRRNKLRHVNTLDDVVRLLKGAQNVIVLTGAGVSVSCGIPDFRSRDGIYSRLAIDFPNLPDPQAMFDISYFSQDPRPFFKFARDIYPGKFQPSPCHRFIKLMEKHRKLLRNYTQNIDTLEKEANIDRVIECHGSFATATCTKCGHKTTADRIRETVLAQKIPLCEVCHSGKESSVSTDELTGEASDYRELVTSGIMKPDIVFFGEGLPDTFHEAMAADKSQCDLLVVIGSSLKVRPVALIPSSLPAHVPQILINREPLPHCHFDVELLGDCDVIINHLCQLLGNQWTEGIYSDQKLSEAPHLLPLRDTVIDIDEKSSEPSYSTPENSSSSVKCECTSSSDCACVRPSFVDADDATDFKNKERHMSIDSARDSGIGDNSNLTDVETDTENKNGGSFGRKVSTEDMRGFWQPKVKKSLADRLPEDCYYNVPPSRYIFPGAEVFYDPDENSQFRDDSDSGGSESESDGE